MSPTELQTPEAFQTDVVGASHQQPIVAVVWAEWCRPCGSLKGKLQAICDAHRTPLVRIDAEKLVPLARELRVRSVPTVMVFNRGKEILRFSGDKTAGELETILMKTGAFQQPLL